MAAVPFAGLWATHCELLRLTPASPPYALVLSHHPLLTKKLSADHITFRLGNSGHHALKVVPYGPIRVVLPYIIRRAQENSSVLGRVAEERTKVTRALLKRTLFSL